MSVCSSTSDQILNVGARDLFEGFGVKAFGGSFSLAVWMMLNLEDLDGREEAGFSGMADDDNLSTGFLGLFFFPLPTPPPHRPWGCGRREKPPVVKRMDRLLRNPLKRSS